MFVQGLLGHPVHIGKPIKFSTSYVKRCPKWPPYPPQHTGLQPLSDIFGRRRFSEISEKYIVFWYITILLSHLYLNKCKWICFIVLNMNCYLIEPSFWQIILSKRKLFLKNFFVWQNENFFFVFIKP